MILNIDRQTIPAEPGWYARRPGGPRRRIIAWITYADNNEDILLPFVERDAGKPPVLYTVYRIEEEAIEIVYESTATHRMF